MENSWIKRSKGNTVEAFLEENGLNLNDLICPPGADPSTIDGLPAAAECIQEYAIRRNRPVVIVGDYDADGITATAILVKLFRCFNVNPRTIIPRRFTDGYGMSVNMVADIHDSLIITVDNGIAAIDAVKKAKENGNRVVILDHHLPGPELPCADVIVDPHVAPEKNGFVDYCGAGLAYKLAEYFLAKNPFIWNRSHLLLHDLFVLATIGTIADVMPLVGDNRRIVKMGLELIQRGREFSAGLQWLIQWAGVPFNEDSIKFKIGPLVNAPGRLYDAGSSSSLKMLLCDNAIEAASYLNKMVEINSQRKTLTQTYTEKALEHIHEKAPSNIIVLKMPGMPEGLTGLVAGKLAEQNQCVAFVFAEAKGKPGLWKGSGRSFGGFDMSGILPAIKDFVVTAGGHAGAAGVSTTEDQFDAMKSKMHSFMEQAGKWTVDTSTYYDIELSSPDDAIKALADLKTYAPFGEGVPRPVFMWSDFVCTTGRGSPYHFRTMGTEQQHLKLFGHGCDAIGFNLTHEYTAINSPEHVDLIGDMQENFFNGVTTPQFAISFLRPKK